MYGAKVYFHPGKRRNRPHSLASLPLGAALPPLRLSQERTAVRNDRTLCDEIVINTGGRNLNINTVPAVSRALRTQLEMSREEAEKESRARSSDSRRKSTSSASAYVSRSESELCRRVQSKVSTLYSRARARAFLSELAARSLRAGAGTTRWCTLELSLCVQVGNRMCFEIGEVWDNRASGDRGFIFDKFLICGHYLSVNTSLSCDFGISRILLLYLSAW